MKLFSYLFGAFLLLAAPAMAQEAVDPAAATVAPVPADPFTVTGIAIDMPVASPQAARDQALAAAQRAGYQKLKEQIAAANPGTTLPDVDGAQLNRMMQTFEVTGERMSAKRYIGSYTIRFRPAVVQHAASGAIAGAPVDAMAATPSATSSMNVVYRFAALPDWVDAERQLRQTPGIAGLDIVAIGKSYVRIDLRFGGTRETLMTILSNTAFDLVQTGPDDWQLQRRGATPS